MIDLCYWIQLTPLILNLLVLNHHLYWIQNKPPTRFRLFLCIIILVYFEILLLQSVASWWCTVRMIVVYITYMNRFVYGVKQARNAHFVFEHWCCMEDNLVIEIHKINGRNVEYILKTSRLNYGTYCLLFSFFIT